uniref:C-type lectin domain-containing protein n=1 Tax=Salmo trutta TaxID=8032 RepID=A0A673XNA1_SALTR
MGHSLFLLFFSGLSVLPSCLSHQFHFVDISKNWTEAQSYCRQNYTDLASIDDMADMNRLNNTIKAVLLTEPAWIGLYNTSWRWSLGDTELEREGFWDKSKGQPNNVKNNEFCVWMQNGSWHDANCGEQHNFVCYGEFLYQSAFSLSFLPSFCLSTSQTPNSLDSVQQIHILLKTFYFYQFIYGHVFVCLNLSLLEHVVIYLIPCFIPSVLSNRHKSH